MPHAAWIVRDALVLGAGLVLAVTGWRWGRTGRLFGSDAPAPAGAPTEDLRERFLATVSHELRTPLNAIVGWTQVLKSGRLQPSDVAHAVDAIERNARVQVRLVNELLELSSMRQGRLAIARQPVDLLPIVTRTVDAWRPAARAKRLSLASKSHAKPIRVLGDEGKLDQLLRHILGNAVKFTPAGGRIDVAVRANGAFARIDVRDTGIGIDREHLPHVSEPFYQTGACGARAGLGVGLALAREIAALHGGTIDIDSGGPQKGTTVTVHLPLSRALPPQRKNQ